MFNLTTITGATVTGLTLPTYTATSMPAPDVNGKQYSISALGGTQTGVLVHSISNPFTITQWLPKILKTLTQLTSTTGLLKKVPINTHKVVVRKGLIPAAGYNATPADITIAVNIPAGAETFDAQNMAALFSCAAGVLNAQADALFSSAKTGT